MCFLLFHPRAFKAYLFSTRTSFCCISFTVLLSSTNFAFKIFDRHSALCCSHSNGSFLSIALLPFLLQSNPIEQMQAIFSRLFPFQRGLVHSYWAPNVWALYTATDYLLYLVLSSQKLIPKASVTPAYLSGLVGDHAFMLLPRISPLISLLLVLSTLLPAVTTIYRSPSSRVLQQAVLYAALSVFMVGYHVHEKAILPVYLLATLHTFLSPSHTQFMAILATPAITCLFPLLFHPTELVTKAMIAIVYFSALWCFVICEFSASFKRF